MLISNFLISPSAQCKAGELGKATIVLCYGYVCAYGPPSQVTARVDVHIVKVILRFLILFLYSVFQSNLIFSFLLPFMYKSMTPHLEAAKSLSFKRAAIAALDLIGKAVHPAHLKQDYTLKQRTDLLKHLVALLTRGDVDMKVRALGLAAATTLCRLAPAVPEEDEAGMLSALLPFFDLKPGEASAELDKRRAKAREKAQKAAQKAGREYEPPQPKPGESDAELLDATQQNLRTLLLVMLAPAPDAHTLVRMFRHLEQWITSSSVTHRERAMAAVLALLNEHLRLLRRRQRRGADLPPSEAELEAAQQKQIANAAHAADDAPLPTRGFSSLGACIAMCVPRCTDPSAAVRPAAVAAIETLLYTDHIMTHRDAADADVAAAAKHGGGEEDDDDDDDDDTGARSEVPAESLPARLAAMRKHRVAITAPEAPAQYRTLQALAKDILARRDVLGEEHMLSLLLGCLRGFVLPLFIQYFLNTVF